MEKAVPAKQFKFPSFNKIKQIGNYQIWRNPNGKYSIIEKRGLKPSKTIEPSLPSAFIAQQIVEDLQETVNIENTDK